MKLTIITINYNNAAGLKKTIESEFAQTYKDIQNIIIDVASTDGSE
jgi:glycosyltransferase involved in cell wall biosynthesis